MRPALALCVLFLFASSGCGQAARNPNHEPPENIWWSDPATYTATLGAGATFDFSGVALLNLGAFTTNGTITGASTYTFTRPTTGAVTITSADDDTDANFTIKAGGTGVLTLGDVDSTWAANSSTGQYALFDVGLDHFLNLRVEDQTATRVLVVPILTGTDTLATLGLAQTFSGVKTFTATTVFTGGQTRSAWIRAADMFPDATSGPAAATVGTTAVGQFSTLAFDADGGATGDDWAWLVWTVPAGYVTDSLSLRLVWLHIQAETGADAVAWDGTVLAIAQGESSVAAGTGMAVVSDTSTDGTANLLLDTVLDPEVLTIAVGDTLNIGIFCDESASAMSATASLIGIELTWESNE